VAVVTLPSLPSWKADESTAVAMVCQPFVIDLPRCIQSMPKPGVMSTAHRVNVGKPGNPISRGSKNLFFGSKVSPSAMLSCSHQRSRFKLCKHGHPKKRRITGKLGHLLTGNSTDSQNIPKSRATRGTKLNKGK